MALTLKQEIAQEVGQVHRLAAQLATIQELLLCFRVAGNGMVQLVGLHGRQYKAGRTDPTPEGNKGVTEKRRSVNHPFTAALP